MGEKEVITAVLHGKEYRLAEPGLSGAVCRRCGVTLTEAVAHAAMQLARCPNCGYDHWDALQVFEVRAMSSMLPFFDDETVMNSIWFHATTTDDWYKTLLQKDDRVLFPELGKDSSYDFTIMVHLGTLDAALDRACDHTPRYDQPKNWYIHEVKILPGAVLAPTIVEGEDSDGPEYAFQTREGEIAADKGYDTNGITRYINSYESTGSISLVANIHSFEVVNTTKI